MLSSINTDGILSKNSVSANNVLSYKKLTKQYQKVSKLDMPVVKGYKTGISQQALTTIATIYKGEASIEELTAEKGEMHASFHTTSYDKYLKRKNKLNEEEDEI